MRVRPAVWNGLPVPYDAPLEDLLLQIRELTPSTGAAFVALSFRDDLASLKGLVEAARRVDPYIRRSAIEAIGHHVLGREGESVVGDLLSDSNEYVVRAACEAAGLLHLASLRSRVLALADSRSSTTRATAIRSLRLLWRSDDFSLVLRVFREDPSADVRNEAAWTLNDCVNESTATRLFDAFWRDSVPRHRVWACELAARFNVGQTPQLTELIADSDGHVRTAARKALSSRG